MMNSDIKVESITDHEDGTATLSLNMDAATYHKVFEYGFIKLITKGLDMDVSTNAPQG
jgi:hypothetical protein